MDALSDARLIALKQSLALHKFIRETQGEESWIRVAFVQSVDPSWTDARNLRSKLSKHDAFETDVRAHKVAVDDMLDRGAKLAARHPRSKIINKAIVELSNHWEGMYDAMLTKGHMLKHAIALEQYERFTTDIENYISHTLVVAESTDVGRDVDENAILQREVESLEKGILNNTARVTAVYQLASTLLSTDQYGKETVINRQSSIKIRWAALLAAVSNRKQNLLVSNDVHR